MSTKHTPGPWHQRSMRIVAAADGSVVAAVAGDDDACLIAAAPELLVALRTLEYAARGQENPSHRLLLSMREARSIIAKAEGR